MRNIFAIIIEFVGKWKNRSRVDEMEVEWECEWDIGRNKDKWIKESEGVDVNRTLTCEKMGLQGDLAK
jgi:hypothetical protein